MANNLPEVLTAFRSDKAIYDAVCNLMNYALDFVGGYIKVEYNIFLFQFIELNIVTNPIFAYFFICCSIFPNLQLDY
jgi:hypothetical protein